MIQYIKHNKINKQKWDECIEKSFNGIIYAYSWYLDIVCPNWEALVDEDYKTVMPLTAGKKYSLNYLYQPFFTQQLGVFSVNKMSEEIVDNFLQAIPVKYLFMEINLNSYNKISSSIFALKINLTYELDLINTYENHAKLFSDNLVRNLKLANKENLEIIKDVPANEIITLFRQNRGKKIRNLKNKEYKILEKIITASLSRGKAQIWSIRTNEKKLCAGAFFIESNGKVIFLFSATDALAKTNGAMSFLIDRFIFENAQRNLILDFEGSNDAGLARFYSSFGAKKCLYLHVRKNNLPFWAKWVKR